jgi:hypothetical protein
MKISSVNFVHLSTTTVSNLDNSFPEYGRLRSKTESCNILPGSQQRMARDSNWFFENPRPRSVTVTGTNENCRS